MDIEKIATNIVALSISNTDYLSPFIKDGDKEPSWDGRIYAYYNIDKEKCHLSGVAPVQVKGRHCNDFIKKEISYSIEISDLRNYLLEGGTIFFVVYINDDGEGKIYYSNLLPFMIRNLLYEKGEQQSISIKLSEFPKLKNEKDNLVLNFVSDRKKQSNLKEGKNESLFDFDIVKNFDSLGFSYNSIGYDKVKPYEYMFNHGVYLYGKNKNFNIEIPVEYIPNIEEVSTVLNRQVCVGEKKFYDYYEVVNKKNFDELHFGKSTVWIFSHNGEDDKINFKLKGTLKERITDEDFYLSLINHKELYINSNRVSLHSMEGIPNQLVIKKFKSHLQHLKTVNEVFNTLGIIDNLDCNSLSDKDEKYIQMLILAIKHHQDIEFEEHESFPFISQVVIANLQIMLIFEPQINGKYKISNFFKESYGYFSIDNEGSKFDSSQFILLNVDNFCKLSNIDFKVMEKSLFSVHDSEQYHYQVNTLLLTMLKAYDIGAPRKDKLLDSAINIAEWLNNKKIILHEISIINLIQCYLRKRGQLIDSEVAILCEIIESHEQEEMILTGAYLLLGNQMAAKQHFNRLKECEQKQLIDSPIFIYWKD